MLDCSALTDQMTYGGIKLPDLNFLRNQITKNSYIGTLDLESFYLHFALDPTFSNMLCFEWTFDDHIKEKVCYEPVVMIFGIPSAPFICTQVTNVVVKSLHQTVKSRVWPFIDDFPIITQGTYGHALEDFTYVRYDLPKWGFKISEPKVVYPKRENVVLGFLVNTENMTFKFDESKMKELSFLVYEALEPRMKAKYLARIVGKVLSMGFATKIPVHAFLSSSINLLARETRSGKWYEWHKRIVISPDIVQELRYLVENLKAWNGVPIHKPYKIDFFFSNEDVQDPEVEVWAGDSSGDACGIFEVRRRFKFSVEYFSDTLREQSSARRELAAIENLILHKDFFLEDHITLVYISDNLTVNRWVNSGTCRRDVAPILKKIHLQCLSRGIDLRVTWARRTHTFIEVADALSRRSTDEYSLRRRDEEYIKKQVPFVCTLDVFASDFSHVCAKFYSKMPSMYSSGTDGMYSPWQEVCWIFPPRRLLANAIRRIHVEEGLVGVLIALKTTERLIEKWLFNDNDHAPPFVQDTWQYPMKVKMSSGQNNNSLCLITFRILGIIS